MYLFIRVTRTSQFELHILPLIWIWVRIELATLCITLKNVNFIRKAKSLSNGIYVGIPEKMPTQNFGIFTAFIGCFIPEVFSFLFQRLKKIVNL